MSENSVPNDPMVLLIIIPMKNGYFIGNIPYFQTNPREFLMGEAMNEWRTCPHFFMTKRVKTLGFAETWKFN